MVIAAHPAEKALAGFAIHRFDRVVKAADADALGLQGIDGAHVIVGEVLLAAIAINDDRFDPIQELLVARPTGIFLVVVDRSVESQSARVQAIREKQRARIVLVGVVAMAHFAGDKQDFGLIGGQECRRGPKGRKDC